MLEALDRTLSAAATALPERHAGIRDTLRAATHIGDGVVHLAVFPILYRFGPEPLRATIRRLVAATAIAIGLLYPIRAIFKRHRPIGDVPAEYALFPKADVYSFPSGHAMRNFLLADLIGRDYPAARPLLYLYASLIAVARIFLKLHYPSDILGGALLGIAIGRAVDHAAGIRRTGSEST